MKIIMYKNDNRYCLVNNQAQLFNSMTNSSFIRANLYAEWNIWFKCFGKILVINGTSSSGKTNLSKNLSKYGFNLVSMDDVLKDIFVDYVSSKFPEKMFLAKKILTPDDMLKILRGFKIRESRYEEQDINLIQDFQQIIQLVQRNINSPTSIEIFDRIFAKSQKFIFSGENVVIDVVADGCYIDINVLSYSFMNYPMKIGLLYNSLEENLRKCFQRNYISLKNNEEDFRYPSGIINQYKNFYKFVIKDDIYKYTDILEKIDKELIKGILEVAIYCEHNLSNDLKFRQVYSDEIIYDSQKELDNAVKILKKVMMLETSAEVFVIPAVKYDFIIKDSNLKRINNYPLIIGKGHYEELSLTDKKLVEQTIFVHQNTVEPKRDFEHSKKVDCDATNTITPIDNTINLQMVANLLNIRFLMYNGEGTLPIIIGNNGSIIEFEHDLKIVNDDRAISKLLDEDFREKLAGIKIQDSAKNQPKALNDYSASNGIQAPELVTVVVLGSNGLSCYVEDNELM